MKFGLETMRALCAALEHPERAFQPVVVAGTNGKGSVTAMTSASLHAAGHRVARYTSPHLERLEERFVIDEREVATADLRDAAAAVQDAVAQLLRQGTLGAPPTFFECTTAVAFELFRRARVDVAVLEVGLGGRLDATNVVMPLAVAITTIDLDHQAQLGNTLESIAFEKAGVIKDGIPVVCGWIAAPAQRVIDRVCRERGAARTLAAERVRLEVDGSGSAASVSMRTPAHELNGLRLPLPGLHQAQNAAVALCLIEAIDERGVAVGTEAIRAGLAQARWPARLERFRRAGADVLLDAAHNPAGMRALASYLREEAWAEVTLVFGVMRDKDVGGMLQIVAPLVKRLICTTAPGPRAMSAAELAALARGLPDGPAAVEIEPDPPVALARACDPGARVVAAGSIFLIGPLRGILR